MQQRGLNHKLIFSPIVRVVRKVVDLVHVKDLTTKASIGIFGGSILVGTGVVIASSQNNFAPAPSPQTHNTSPANTDYTSAINSSSDPKPSAKAANTDNQSNNTRSSTSNSHTEVSINGETVPVSNNGSIHKTITDGNSTTTVDITNQGTAQNGTTSYTNIQTNSYSSGTANTSSIQTESHN